MITEDYVSFETARLLKEKGFDEACNRVYQGPNLIYKDIPISPLMSLKELGGFHPNQLYLNHNELGDIVYTAPTLQMAMKWLRIEHNIHIEPHIVKTKHSYGYMPNYIDLKKLKPNFPFDEFDFSNADKYASITYDKACEVTLKYCLENLIV